MTMKQSELKRAGAAKSASETSTQNLPRSVDLIPINEAAERLGMTRGAFMTLRKSLGIKAVGYKINWPTVIKRLEDSTL